MPKKSKKSKSKRQTLKQKYKVLRKVKEHHRKKRKEAKKNGTLNKAPKDPGIPNSWPFKEELIQQLKAQKERAAERERTLQQAQREAATVKTGDLSTLHTDAAQRGKDYEKSSTGVENNGATPGSYVDYSLKAFYRDFAKVVEASDVIIQVLDARDPAGTRVEDVEKFVRKMGPNKKIILLLNKIDLVPREVVEAWLKYLREELPAVAFKCSTQRQSTNLGRRSATMSAASTNSSNNNNNALKGAECLGADTLLQLLKNYARGNMPSNGDDSSKGKSTKTSITVGVVGLPNVGKSSVINSLKRTRVAQVGNQPGITKSVQEIHLDKQVTLLDSPGVVFAAAGADGAAAAALRNCVRVEQMDDPVLPVAEIVRRCPAKQLMTLYKIPLFSHVDEFLGQIATVRGKLKRGGAVDASAAARIVLQDWNDGRIRYYTMPPKRMTDIAGTSAVVTDWGAQFNANEVFAAENSAVIAGLPGLEDDVGGHFQTETAGGVVVGLDTIAESDEENMSGSDLDDDDDDGDVMDEGDAPTVVKAKGSEKNAQNVQLYGEKGQFNPHAARAVRKRRKKDSIGHSVDEVDEDDEYDFAADWDDATDKNAYDALEDDDEEEDDAMER